jgi:hypothetical protein
VRTQTRHPTPTLPVRAGTADWSVMERRPQRTRWASPPDLVGRRPWNVAALLAPFVALILPPAGLCLGLVAAGQIGVGRQRGLAFAVAGIVLGAILPVVLCVGSALA